MPPKGDHPQSTIISSTLGKQIRDHGNHKLEEHLDNQEEHVKHLKGEVGQEAAVKTLDAKKPDTPPNPIPEIGFADPGEHLGYAGSEVIGDFD